MNNTWFNVPEKDAARVANIYRKTPNGLEKGAQLAIGTQAYFSGAGGLTCTAEDYLQFAQMLANGGQLNGKRILSPWTVDTMLSNNVGDLFNGQIGRPPKGVGFGLGGEVVVSAVDARLRKPDGSYGWDGAYGTYWWVNRKEQMVVVMFVQTPGTVAAIRLRQRSFASGHRVARLRSAARIRHGRALGQPPSRGPEGCPYLTVSSKSSTRTSASAVTRISGTLKLLNWRG